MSVGIRPFVLVGAPTLVRSDRRNQSRNQRRRLGKEPAVVILSDSDTALELERVATADGVTKLLQFDTQLPVVTFTAVLQVYRASSSFAALERNCSSQPTLVANTSGDSVTMAMLQCDESAPARTSTTMGRPRLKGALIT